MKFFYFLSIFPIYLLCFLFWFTLRFFFIYCYSTFLSNHGMFYSVFRIARVLTCLMVHFLFFI
jgi:hypothetical protein